MKLKNLFTAGKMNKDLDERLVPKGESRDALNIKVANSNGSGVGAMENALSNDALSNASFGANASTIGSIADDRNRKIYWFVKSDTGSYLMEYAKDSNQTKFVLTDTRPDGSNVLNLSKAHRITGINIFYDEDYGKVFIYWTDNLNPPRRIDIQKAKLYNVNGFTEDDISVIKATPRKEPRIVGVEGDNPEESNLWDNFYSFAYRYRYENNEYSALSPFSDWGFKPGLVDNESTDNPAMFNHYTALTVYFNTGDKNVEEVELYVKGADSQNMYLVHTLDVSGSIYSTNQEVPFVFKNDALYSLLPEDQFNRVYDNVPLQAAAQDMIGNRMIYSDYVENYDLTDANGNDIAFNLSLDRVSTGLSQACATSNSYTITRIGTNDIFYYRNCDGENTEVKLDPNESITICGYSLANVTDNTAQYTKVDNGPCDVFEPKPTLRSNRTYDVGMVYFDKYGRKSTVLTGLSNVVKLNHYFSETANQIEASISHNAPYWADRYKFAIKETELDYYTLRTKGPFYRAKEDNVDYYYIKMSQTELNKASNGNTLILKNNGDGNAETLYKYEVISVANQEADFIGVGTQEEGVYLKLKGNTTILDDTLVEPYNIIFESLPDKTAEGTYYEVPGTFDVVNGLHKGLSQDQTSTQPAKVLLNAYNAYCFGNGVESNRINDAISGATFTMGVRVNDEIDSYGKNNRVASHTYSNVYDSTTSYNGLNEFNLSMGNYKDMDPSYGRITLIHSRDNDLICFQENKIHRILFNKSVLYNADGTGNVSQSINVLGQEVAYNGEYGISHSPESFQAWGYDMLFADERRGAICRLSENGIFEISNYGMRDWFNDNLSTKEEDFVLGGYDPINDHYVVSIRKTTPEWREDTYVCGEGVEQWREDTYSCVQGNFTTTTTTGAPTTTTTTATPTTTTTTTEAPETTTTTTSTTTCTPNGTLLSTYCSGNDLYGTYANGSCGTYNQLIESNSSSCVTTTCTPNGTLLSTYCVGNDLYGTYANGSCGTYSQLIESNSSTCATTTCTPNGTLLSTYCVGNDLYGTYANGSCGTYNQLIESNSSSCVTTTTTSTTTGDPYNYYAVRGCPGSFYENRDMYIRTTSTLPNAGGNPSSASSIYWNGQSFYAYSTISASSWASGSGDLASITYSGSVGTGCPVVATTTTTTTQAATTTTTAAPTPARCTQVFYPDTINASSYGVRWLDANNTEQNSAFSSFFGTPTSYGGYTGYIVTVCSKSTSITLDVSSNTLVTVAGVAIVSTGSTCTSEFDCT